MKDFAQCFFKGTFFIIQKVSPEKKFHASILIHSIPGSSPENLGPWASSSKKETFLPRMGPRNWGSSCRPSWADGTVQSSPPSEAAVSLRLVRAAHGPTGKEAQSAGSLCPGHFAMFLPNPLDQ